VSNVVNFVYIVCIGGLQHRLSVQSSVTSLTTISSVTVVSGSLLDFEVILLTECISYQLSEKLFSR